jgi:hypothetical protein
MRDPLFRAAAERDIALLADPEVELSAGYGDNGMPRFALVRRRGIRTTDPTFRFRSPDAA